MLKWFTDRAKHFYAIVLRQIWAMAWVTLVTILAAALTWRDEILPPEIAKNWRVPAMISMLPHWDWGWWAILSAMLVIAVLIDGSFRINKNLEEKIAQVTATRANLEFRIGTGEPYLLSQANWLFWRFHVFNCGPATDQEVNVELREIRPRPKKYVGLLDFPLNSGRGGSLKSQNEAAFSIFDVCKEMADSDGIVRWQASRLGQGLNSTPTISLESGGQWEFDYILQAANADDVAFTLIVRASGDTVSGIEKARPPLILDYV